MYMFYMYICTIYILYKASEKKRNVCNLNKFYFIHIYIYIYSNLQFSQFYFAIMHSVQGHVPGLRFFNYSFKFS